MTPSSYAPSRTMARTPARQRSTATAEHVVTFETDLGWVAAVWRGDLLARLTFGHSTPKAAWKSLGTDIDPSEPTRPMRSLIKRLKAFSSGKRVDEFSDVALDISDMTPFQQAVVERCRRISPGESLTYGELAEAVGHPKAARAVGTVMSKNRFPIIVPCHRVMAAGGAIGGFSAPDGVGMKRRLLAPEQVEC